MKIPDELLFRRRKHLPVILSAEGAECGLACVAMVANYHGHEIDLNGLRQVFNFSLSGATLRSLMTIADRLELSTRALKCEMKALSNITLPAILHWNLNHFVVLKSINKSHAVIHDPSQGRIVLSLDEVSKRFTGVALELNPSSNFSPMQAKANISIHGLLANVSGGTTAIIQIVCLSVAMQIVAFAAPFQMQLIIDDALAHSDKDILVTISIGFSVLLIIQATVSWLRDWTLQLFESQFLFQVIGNLVKHLMRLPSSYFEKRHIGDIISRLSAANSIKDTLANGLISALIDGFMAVIAGIVLIIYSPPLAGIVLLSVALAVAVNTAYYPAVRRRMEEFITSSAKEQSHIMETVRAASTIKLMGRETEIESSWRNLYVKTFNASVSSGRLQMSLTFLQTTIFGLQTIAVLYVGAAMIIDGHGLSVGMLIAFLSFRQTFTDRAQSLVSQAVKFKMLELYLERLSDIVAQEPEASPLVFKSHVVEGAMSLRHVSFRYGASDPWILKDVNLDVCPGEFIALVGPSGSGKSTLLKLMLGLQLPIEGQIFLDGQAADPDLWRAWRSQVGVVTQDDKLLSGTLADNIAFFDPELDLSQVHSAAMHAEVHNDICRMTMQYQTAVGDMGSTLSAGQRQRVLLARALYRHPKILILDEGTANLDESTENAVCELITSMAITRIVVAHRPALVREATRVLQVEGGVVVDKGRGSGVVL